MDWAAHRRDAHNMGRVQEYLKPIVYGGNDGIVTTFAIVAGFTGASMEGAAQIGALAVLVFGLANLFADALSMGMGEFLSGRSQRDLYMRKHAEEIAELSADPEGERRELHAILRDRGMGTWDAEEVAARLIRYPELTADLMMSYEFGMPDPREDNPAANGLTTFLSFVAFGTIPLLPYLLHAPDAARFGLSVGATVLALMALGLLRWFATAERLRRCVGETVLVGGASAIVAYMVGALVAG
nr:VIT1/CCC1 transporter family protein [Maritimibacter sp. 55A14]